MNLTERQFITAIAYTNKLSVEKKKDIVRRYCGFADRVKAEGMLLELLAENLREREKRGYRND